MPPPGNVGLRLSRKAPTPSARSSLAAIMPPPERLDHRARGPRRPPAWIMYFATSTARGDSAVASSAIATRRAARILGDLGDEAERQAHAPPGCCRPNSAISLHHRLGQQPRQPLRARPARHDADPRLGQGQRCAPGAITRMSQAAASSSPPPKAWPFSAAIVGFDSRASRSKIRCPLAHPVPREVAGRQVAPGGDVGAGAEGAVALARHHHRAHCGVALERVAMARQAASSIGDGQGVQLRRVVEPQLGDARRRRTR